ncbi:MAG TPA: M23 family metallopeptidase [Chryseolinea sp.]|nr:M23 family metallopeptidase [Chryseolinea sp.]
MLNKKNFWNSKSSRIFAWLLLALPLIAQAQFAKPDEKFPAEEKYLYPVHPGQPGSLAGTMGELRSTHFHSGIDIRTNNMIGLPVVASKSGYISRIAVTPGSYGNVIYITHADGNTTLYAHLDKFAGKLGEFVLQEHYQRKESELDLEFTPDQFPVKQGELIALSGNSGSSSGPHLHFDIRDPENYALDPLKVAGFPELVDKLPPAAEKIALKTLDINSRINDRFGRFEFYAQRVGNNYIITAPIMAAGNIGVELVAKDKLSPQSQFYGGVNYIKMKVDSQVVFNQAIERVNVAETRAIYSLMDFKTMRNYGTRFYKLYIDDGNDLKFYDPSLGSGKIKVNPSKDSNVEIDMGDSDGNQSKLTFTLRSTPAVKEVKSLENYVFDIGYDISENTMMVISKPCVGSANKATVFANGTSVEVNADYYNGNRAVYLVDLRRLVPDSISVCGKTVAPHINISVPSGTDYKYYGELMDVAFPKNAIYDTLYLNTEYSVKGKQEIFTIGTRNVPLHKSIDISLKPAFDYPIKPDVGVYRVAGKSYTYVGTGEWMNGRLNFSTREFGDFTILRDSIGPKITPLVVNGQNARFKIKDDLSGVDSIEAYVNGKWVLLAYDSKSNTIWTRTLKPEDNLKGNFELVITDNAGNKSRYLRKIL